MRTDLPSRFSLTFVAFAAFSFVSISASAGIKEKVLVNFSTGNGNFPNSNLITDPDGNLYGTTYQGGSEGWGVVFEVSLSGEETVLYNFCSAVNCADGRNPAGNLLRDSSGNLYGTTTSGGIQANCVFSGGCGVVFELSPNGDGTWMETLLYSFAGGSDGENPIGGLNFDSAGNLYGTAAYAGNDGAIPGVVFELSPSADGAWTETVLYTFAGGASGANPDSTQVFDAAGNLYGTTGSGGSQDSFCSIYSGCGVVYELTPTESGPWQETVLHTFTDGADGAFPSGVVVDSSGGLLGEAEQGGSTNCDHGCGLVFELSPGSQGWTENVLYSFTGGADGEWPYGGFAITPSGSLYGTTYLGGTNGKDGVAFELMPNRSGGWIQHSLSFGGKLGRQPQAGLTLGPSGQVYGTASIGGSGHGGTVFELQ